MPLLRTILFFFLFSFISGNAFGQSIKGSWYGVGHIQMDGNTEHYLSELVLKQDGTILKGEFNYYFRDSLFKNKINCTYNSKTRLLIIKSFPIIYYRSVSTKQAVMVNVMGTFELRVAKTGSVINGSLTSSSERTLLMPVINYRLIKDTIETVTANQTKTTKPTTKAKGNTAVEKSANNPINKKQQTALTTLIVAPIDTKAQLGNKKKIDTSIHTSKTNIDTSIHTSNTKIDPAKQQKVETPVIIPTSKITEEAFIARKKDYAKIIEVDNSKLRLEVYDNGTIDYDSVSLFLNDKMILPKTMLNHHSVKLTIDIDESLEFNELGMFAENLGLIPPNTAALIIHDGKKTYEITLNSDFSKNAIVQIRKKKSIKKD
jgi:hypothetical protein